MDDIDSKLLTLLEQDARTSWSDLADTVGMSAPGVMDRVRRLEERGAIQGYSARLSLRELGFSLTGFVFLKLAPGTKRETFLKLIDSTPQFAECHHVTGQHDYLLKVRCRDTSELDALLVDTLKGSGLVSATETMISLSETHSDMAASRLLGNPITSSGRKKLPSSKSKR